MLSSPHRLTEAAGFTAAVRSGRRSGSRLLVAHYAPGDGVQVGFVVSRAVGNAVTRNLVKRRLRHLMRDRIEGLPAGTWVVRAQPATSSASFGELGAALDRCLSRASAGRSVA